MPLHLWLCKKNLYGKDFRKTSESVWRFESVHGFASVGNLYQKMHFAGSNPATVRKTPKCIYKISKNFRVEKSGEISRNLRFLLIFFCGVDGSDQNSLHLNTSIQNGFIVIISTLDQKLKPIFGFGAFL